MKMTQTTLAVTMATVLGIAMPALAQRSDDAKARVEARASGQAAVDAAKEAREASKRAKKAAKAAAAVGDRTAVHGAHTASVAAEDAKNDAVEAAQRAEGAVDAAERGIMKRNAAADAAVSSRAAKSASERATANSAAARRALEGDEATRSVPVSPNASPNARIATSAPGAMADYRHTTGSGRFHIDTNVLDVNHDGFLSREEAAANLTLNADFATIDANSDGRIANDELRGWVSSGGLAKNSRPVSDLLGGVGMANGFQMLDLNGDGMLSTGEARMQSRLNARFRALDTNRDGRLSQAEYDVWVQANAGKR